MSRYNNYSYSVPVVFDQQNKRRVYSTLINPTIEKRADDIYIVTAIGDRLDLLAWKYYSDPELWWIISAANPELRKDSLYLEPGIQIRIPKTYQDILTEYYKQNSIR